MVQNWHFVLKMSHFLRLPLEIRTIIYEYCLIVDYVIDPYPSTYELCKQATLDRSPKTRYGKRVSKPELPAVSILKVNIQLHCEASRILYGLNRWKFPQSSWNTEYSFSVFETHGAFFNDVEMRFDWREGNFRMNMMMMDEDFRFRDGAIPQMEEKDHGERQDALHNPGASYKFKDSSQELALLVPHVNSLVIDVALLLCSVGCCRRIVFDSHFQREFVQPLVKDILRSRIQTVKIVGMMVEIEEKLVYEEWGFQKDGTVDRAAMAKKWALDFPPVPESGDERLYGEEGEPVIDFPCRLCFDVGDSDESSVCSLSEGHYGGRR